MSAHDENPIRIPAVTRRGVVTTVAVGAAATSIAACGGSEETGGGSSSAGGESSSSAAGGASTQSGSGATSGGGGGTSVPTSKVPVGGGYVDEANKFVVTQPTAGTFKAFTAVCTHEQCTVDKVENNQIECPCHASMFDATTGEVKDGPADSPLAAKQVTVSGSTLQVS